MSVFVCDVLANSVGAIDESSGGVIRIDNDKIAVIMEIFQSQAHVCMWLIRQKRQGDWQTTVGKRWVVSDVRFVQPGGCCLEAHHARHRRESLVLIVTAINPQWTLTLLTRTSGCEDGKPCIKHCASWDPSRARRRSLTSLCQHFWHISNCCTCGAPSSFRLSAQLECQDETSRCSGQHSAFIIYFIICYLNWPRK
jgi:hypothetical protein